MQDESIHYVNMCVCIRGRERVCAREHTYIRDEDGKKENLFGKAISFYFQND